MNIANTQEYNDVTDVLAKYLEGSNGNVALLKEAFHDNAIINGRPIQALYDAVERKGKTNSTNRIDYLDIVGNVASARTVIENWHGYHFVEYQHLVKSEQGWKITSKTYTEAQLADDR